MQLINSRIHNRLFVVHLIYRNLSKVANPTNQMSGECGVTLNEVKDAYQRISPYVHKTPVYTSRQANERTGRNLFFKCECMQKSGSFKARGALNSILKIKESGRACPGVTTHSSGNHGQAVSWASSVAGIPCAVVVPAFAPEVKKSAIRCYGAELVECGPKAIDRYDTCDMLQRERNLEYISSSDHPDVIAGQGTVALEFLDQVPNLDAILVPISGGGISAGTCIAAKAIKPSIKVCPLGKKLEECLRTGKRPWEGPQQYLDTLADGLKLQQTGQITTPVLIELAEKDVFEMDNKAVVDGMKFAFERMKLVIEGASAAVVGAAFSDKLKNMDPEIQNVGVILTGGNVDIENLPW